jgi:hypothetical protein
MLPLLLVVALTAPAPSPSSAPLQTIVTVRSTTFCGQFATHVNNAIDAAVTNDQNLGRLIVGLRAPELSGDDLARRMEKQRLNNVADALYRQYRAGEDEVAHLRALAKNAPDPDQKKEMTDAADALGGVLYRQHLIQRDMDGFLAYLDASEMRADMNALRHQDQADNQGGPIDPRTGQANPLPYWIPPNSSLWNREMAMQPGDESPEQDLAMARAASADFASRLPAILHDELNAGGHVAAASDHCQ